MHYRPACDARVTHHTGIINVRLGVGDGSFAAPLNQPLRRAIVGIEAADFNGDGRPDLVTGSAASPIVSILLGNGDGSLLDFGTYPAGPGAADVVVSDFNRDGLRDLGVANYQNGAGSTASVLLGAGDGSFFAPATFATGDGPFNIAAGDFNEDGFPDLATANVYSNDVSVLINNQNDTFAAPVSYPAGSVTIALVVSDLNGDGNLDLVAANNSAGTVSVLRGNGDGTFLAAQNYPAGAAPISLVVTDFTGDGALDAVVANRNSATVSLLRGNGAGGFLAPETYTVLAGPIDVVAGDFNGDGFPEVAVACLDAGAVAVLLNGADWILPPLPSEDANGRRTSDDATKPISHILPNRPLSLTTMDVVDEQRNGKAVPQSARRVQVERPSRELADPEEALFQVFSPSSR